MVCRHVGSWPCLTLVLGALLAAVSPATAQQPSATPQRPSMSFGTSTVPRGLFELEAGGLATDDGTAVPLFFKYGLTDRLELEFGLDAIRRLDTTDEDGAALGDLSAGVRGRLARTARGASFAWVGFVKIPTATSDAGSGELDFGAVGVASIPLDRYVLDLNLWGLLLGREDGGAVGQLQAIATFYIPTSSGWTPYVEGAWQNTAGGEGHGAFVDAGVSFSASPRAVFDAAAGAGFSEGYPDWTATIGWTILFDRARR